MHEGFIRILRSVAPLLLLEPKRVTGLQRLRRSLLVVATTCEYCGLVVDPTGPAVLLGGKAPLWQPFLEDLRSSAFKLAHAKCFAENNGIDPLLTIITESHRQLRLAIVKGQTRIWELEHRLDDHGSSSESD